MRLARHQRCGQALRRQRCTARRIGGCDKHCEYNDAKPDRFSHGRRDRDVRYARTIVGFTHDQAKYKRESLGGGSGRRSLLSGLKARSDPQQVYPSTKKRAKNANRKIC